MDVKYFKSESYMPPKGVEHENAVLENGLLHRVYFRQDTALRYSLNTKDMAIAYALAYLHRDEYFFFNEYVLEKALPLSRIKASTIYRRFMKFQKKGFIIQSTEDSLILDFIKKKKPQYFPDGRLCEWCGGTSPLLEQHHYPIPRKHAGELTVSICANCHGEYHLLKTKGIYQLKNFLEFFPLPSRQRI